MTPAAIIVENLGKKYVIRHEQRGRYSSLRDVLADHAKAIGRGVIDAARGNIGRRRSIKEDYWALKDVSLEINQGDRVGIIGKNGAGKSTLLKLLCRITEPSTGRIVLNGSIASLLEVGTGFHPELTGRENIFLNGAILGMSKQEIKRRFDEIVSFSEVEKFLDTPVKRFSSGMYVRLAFSVAAHLQTDILIVDEVLAVGDLQFQKKCLGKMESVGREGKTVLFVSHNFAALKSLCDKGILLDRGELLYTGELDEAVSRYSDMVVSNAVNLGLVSIRDSQDEGIEYWPTQQPCAVVVQIPDDLVGSTRAVDISLWANDLMISSASSDRLQEVSCFESGDAVMFRFDPIPLTTRKMHVDVGFRGHDGRYVAHYQRAKVLDVEANFYQLYQDSRMITQFKVHCEIEKNARQRF